METLRISSILPRLRSCFGTRRSTLFVAPSLKSDIRNHSPYALAHGPPPAPPSEQFHGNGYGGRRDADHACRSFLSTTSYVRSYYCNAQFNNDKPARVLNPASPASRPEEHTSEIQ